MCYHLECVITWNVLFQLFETAHGTAEQEIAAKFPASECSCHVMSFGYNYYHQPFNCIKLQLSLCNGTHPLPPPPQEFFSSQK